MAVLLDEGMTSADHLLDIGCGALRLGHLAVPHLMPRHYWGTDASLALMQHGRRHELADPKSLPEDHLVADASFAYPGIPDTITLAIAFGVFTHLPAPMLDLALRGLTCFPRLRAFAFTVFIAAEGAGPTRQPDGVVTHPDRPPYHVSAALVERAVRAAGLIPQWRNRVLPRGQVLVAAVPPQIP